MSAPGNLTYAYDPQGRRTARTSPVGTETYTWDSLDQLTSRTSPSGAASTYLYDAQGRLTNTTQGPFTRTYNYALSDSPVRIGTQLVSASKALTRTERLSYGPTGLLEQRTNDQAPVYPVADGAGGLIAELGEQGQLEELPELDPWGAAADAPSPAGNIEDEKSFGFLGAAGRIEMPDSALTKLGARCYDPEVGAFLSVDPVVGEPAEPARRTPYTYGLSSPARFVDVDGRSAVGDAWNAAKNAVDKPANWVQDRSAEITNDPNASWLAKASVVPIGLLSSLGTSENIGDAIMAIAPIPGPGKLKGLGRAGKYVDDALRGGSGKGKGFTPKPGTRVRPPGVPKNWRIKNADGEGGTRYIDPTNPHNEVRVMPGKPSSPYPNSRKPYVRWKKDGQYLDASGNVADRKDPASSHIPLDQFKFRPELYR